MTLPPHVDADLNPEVNADLPKRVRAGLRPAPTTVAHTTLDSPVGELLLLSDGTALTGLYLAPHSDVPARHPQWGRQAAPFPATIAQLQAYFAGDLTEFDVPLAPIGSAFQLRVWEALRTIPYGRTASYGQIATALGNPKAGRAVGLANGRNPISIIVPCHRVIGASGTLIGYGGGLDRKRTLLALEARVVGQPTELYATTPRRSATPAARAAAATGASATLPI
ncbi:MAG: methylated-DNA--[protein]-cysteine S-methyltransferase [Frankiaceae bacterium]